MTDLNRLASPSTAANKELVRGNSVATLNQIYQHHNSIPIRNRLLNQAKSLQYPSIDTPDISLPPSDTILLSVEGASGQRYQVSAGADQQTGGSGPGYPGSTLFKSLGSTLQHLQQARSNVQVTTHIQQPLLVPVSSVKIINVARRHRKHSADQHMTAKYPSSLASKQLAQPSVHQGPSLWSSDSSSGSSQGASPVRQPQQQLSQRVSAFEPVVRAEPSRSPSPRVPDFTSPSHSAALSPARRILPKISPENQPSGELETTPCPSAPEPTQRRQRKLPQIPSSAPRQLVAVSQPKSIDSSSLRPIVPQRLANKSLSSSSSGSSMNISSPQQLFHKQHQQRNCMVLNPSSSSLVQPSSHFNSSSGSNDTPSPRSPILLSRGTNYLPALRPRLSTGSSSSNSSNSPAATAGCLMSDGSGSLADTSRCFTFDLHGPRTDQQAGQQLCETNTVAGESERPQEHFLQTTRSGGRGRRLSSCGSGLRANFLMNKQHAISEFTPPRSLESSTSKGSLEWYQTQPEFESLIVASSQLHERPERPEPRAASLTSAHVGFRAQSAGSRSPLGQVAGANSVGGSILTTSAHKQYEAELGGSSTGTMLTATGQHGRYHSHQRPIAGGPYLQSRAASATDSSMPAQQGGYFDSSGGKLVTPASRSLIAMQSSSSTQPGQLMTATLQEPLVHSLRESVQHRLAPSLELRHAPCESPKSQESRSNCATFLAIPGLCERERQPSNASTNSMPAGGFGLGTSGLESLSRLSSGSGSALTAPIPDEQFGRRKFGIWAERIAAKACRDNKIAVDKQSRRVRSASQLTGGPERMEPAVEHFHSMGSPSSSTSCSSDSSLSQNSLSLALSESSPSDQSEAERGMEVCRQPCSLREGRGKKKLKPGSGDSDQLTLSDRLKLAKRSANELFRKVEPAQQQQQQHQHRVAQLQQQQQGLKLNDENLGRQQKEERQTETKTTKRHFDQQLGYLSRGNSGPASGHETGNALILSSELGREFDDEQADDLSLFLLLMDKHKQEQQQKCSQANFNSYADISLADELKFIQTSRPLKHHQDSNQGNPELAGGDYSTATANNKQPAPGRRRAPLSRTRSALGSRAAPSESADGRALGSGSSSGSGSRFEAARVMVRRAKILPRSLVKNLTRRASSCDQEQEDKHQHQQQQLNLNSSTGASASTSPAFRASLERQDSEHPHLLSAVMQESRLSRRSAECLWAPSSQCEGSPEMSIFKRKTIQLFRRSRQSTQHSRGLLVEEAARAADEEQRRASWRSTHAADWPAASAATPSIHQERGEEASRRRREFKSQASGRATSCSGPSCRLERAGEPKVCQSRRLDRMKSVITAVTRRLEPLRLMRAKRPPGDGSSEMANYYHDSQLSHQ